MKRDITTNGKFIKIMEEKGVEVNPDMTPESLLQAFNSLDNSKELTFNITEDTVLELINSEPSTFDLEILYNTSDDRMYISSDNELVEGFWTSESSGFNAGNHIKSSVNGNDLKSNEIFLSLDGDRYIFIINPAQDSPVIQEVINNGGKFTGLSVHIEVDAGIVRNPEGKLNKAISKTYILGE